MDNMDNNTAVDFAIDEKMILVKESINTREEIIQKLGGLLFENGYVKDSYTQAVFQREITYPTGLPARVAGVAVPHTDTEHVIKPAVAIATLASPTTFYMMGSPDVEVKVEIIIMLAIHDAKLVIPVLRKIIFILEDDAALTKIKEAKTKSEIKQAMLDHIKSLSEKGK